MKFLFIAPGEMEVPPKSGWGALERVVWNYKVELEKLGHEAVLFNDADPYKALDLYRSFNPDVVHLHLGRHWQLMKMLKAKVKIFTNHGGNFEACKPFFGEVVSGYLSDCSMFVLTSWEREYYQSLGFNDIEIVPNGVDASSFNLDNEKQDKSIYLARVSKIKRQTLFQNMGIDAYFIGPVDDPDFNQNDEKYLGTWGEDDVRKNLSLFANLVLLSSLELQPLVCLEAMSAGLGLVVSEKAVQNLDVSKPWITVIPEEKINDITFINESIAENRKISISMKDEILKYASQMSWEKIVSNHYLPKVEARL